MKLSGMKAFGMLLVVQLFLSIPVFSGAGDAFEYLSAGELNGRIGRKVPGLVIIDSRLANQFEETHIKGAINIPLGEMERDVTLPNVPKDSWLVFYCSGTT
jgi:hypothetical protein